MVRARKKTRIWRSLQVARVINIPKPSVFNKHEPLQTLRHQEKANCCVQQTLCTRKAQGLHRRGGARDHRKDWELQLGCWKNSLRSARASSFMRRACRSLVLNMAPNSRRHLKPRLAGSFAFPGNGTYVPRHYSHPILDFRRAAQRKIPGPKNKKIKIKEKKSIRV